MKIETVSIRGIDRILATLRAMEAVGPVRARLTLIGYWAAERRGCARAPQAMAHALILARVPSARPAANVPSVPRGVRLALAKALPRVVITTESKHDRS